MNEQHTTGFIASPHPECEAERERLYCLLDEAARKAFSRRGLIERHFVLQGRRFAMRFAGDFIAKAMCRALAHLIDHDTSVQPELTIDCWDCTGSGLAFPMPQWPAEHFRRRGEILGLDGQDMRVAFFDWLKLLNVYFPESGRSFYCLADENPFPLQQMGSPALTIFNWWAETMGFQLVHAAAVGTDQGGVLIVGHGGAGKSTLAFSTLNTKLRYLSDDYCLLAGSKPKAVALFSTGKLTEQSLKILPHLQSKTGNAQDVSREKALFYLTEQFPGELLAEAPLRAVVLSHLSEENGFLEPIDPAEAYHIMADSTFRQLAGTSLRSLFRLRGLLNGLPVYRLNHGGNQALTHRLLLDLCAS